ncbi:MAG TPA: cytochrome c oxidase assembly protein [Actinomycetota bacterium]|nr:cytochrome c oxidase assembly protein [Actinomycetota bacterium]
MELVLAAGAGIYGLGLRRVWRTAGPGRLVSGAQARLFAGGWFVTALALLPPLDTAAGHSLTAHMVQHVLLLAVAAPLLAAGAPLPTALWALPVSSRESALAGWRRLVRSRHRHWGTWAVAALVAQSLAMWGWHAPPLYEAALREPALHALEHASYLVTAAAFWWSVGLGAGRPRGASVLLVFAAALPGSALGAAMTLAGAPWYAAYPSLADQQQAGVVMWAFSGLAYVLVAAVVFGAWLSGAERDTPGRPLPTVVVP